MGAGVATFANCFQFLVPSEFSEVILRATRDVPKKWREKVALLPLMLLLTDDTTVN